MNERKQLPMYGVGPVYVAVILLLTAAGIALSAFGTVPAAPMKALRLPCGVLGVLLIASGQLLWWKAVFGARVDEHIKNNSLVTSGVYAWVRNPIYSAFLLACTGALLLANNWWLLILPIVFWLYLTVLMKCTEEKWLAERYGKEYSQYCRRVNRCIPWPPENKGVKAMSELKENTVQHTLCIPLWGRMIAAKTYPDLFPDRDAGRIVKELGVDLSGKKFYKLQYMWMNCLIRQYNLAWEIEHYLQKHPRAAVVELGAGLSCLRREMGNETNPWYCLDMENVIPLRQRHIPLGEHEHNVVCDLNDFSWFDQIDFHPEDGIVFTAGGLFYYFEKEQVRRLFCAMAERFPGGMITFDAVNAMGLKGVNAEVKMAGNETRSFFSLERPKEELESWSDRIVNVVEKDYMDGYLKGGYRKTAISRLFAWVMRTFHMSFMLHVEFRK